MSDLIRTSIRLTPEMHEWYKGESKKIGIPMNAMIIFALKQYQREEKKNMESVNGKSLTEHSEGI